MRTPKRFRSHFVNYGDKERTKKERETMKEMILTYENVTEQKTARVTKKKQPRIKRILNFIRKYKTYVLLCAVFTTAAIGGISYKIHMNTDIDDFGRTKLVNAYTVTPNDTLYDICNQNFINNPEYASVNSYVNDVMRINNMTSDTIVPGEVLLIPYFTDAPIIERPVSENNRVKTIGIYTICADDTLYAIANEMIQTNPEYDSIYSYIAEVKSINNMESDYLMTGDTLKLPYYKSPETTDTQDT